MNKSIKSSGGRKIVIIAILVLLAAFLSIYIIGKSKTKCPYDLNGDGKVGIADISAIATSLGKKCSGCREDINSDGRVDNLDVELISGFMDFGCDSIEFNTTKKLK
jgi:hypothetical protein